MTDGLDSKLIDESKEASIPQDASNPISEPSPCKAHLETSLPCDQTS